MHCTANDGDHYGCSRQHMFEALVDELFADSPIYNGTLPRCVYMCPMPGAVLEYVDSSVWNELVWECTYPQWGGDAAAAEFFVPGRLQCLSACTQQFYGCSWEGPFLYDAPGQG